MQVSESRYRRLFEAAKDGILLLNAETAQIEDVNPFLMDMLGYSHDEFLGKKIWEIGAFKDTVQNIVAKICSRIATELELSAERIHGLHLAASIHDLSKISISAVLLIMPRRLTAIEFNMIKEHPDIAFNILKNVNFPWPLA